ncbi:MAG: CheR family methyltransferase [Chloroflexota bacterium]
MTAFVHAGALEHLLEKIYQHGGYDFRQYREGTVVRRLERRLRATETGTYSAYMGFLDRHPEEYQKLAEELTIKVSGFFRNPCTFEELARLVLPEILSRKKSRGEGTLRFWSAACAGGEEPYSLAMLLRQQGTVPGWKALIHATDISRQALKKAVSEGAYTCLRKPFDLEKVLSLVEKIAREKEE